MSVRKEYSVVVGSEVIFTGSYTVALKVYSSFERFRTFYSGELPVCSISFRPIERS